MSYLRIKRIGKAAYYYIVRSERKGNKVRSKNLEYLGRDPDPKRLKRAMEYWGVNSVSNKAARRGRSRV